MKRAATSAKDSYEAEGLIEFTKPVPPSLPGKWAKRRKDQPGIVSDFMFQRRREISLCLISFSLVCLIIGSLTRSSYGKQVEKDSSKLRTSSFLDTKDAKTSSSLLLPDKKDEEKRRMPVKNPDEMHRISEINNILKKNEERDDEIPMEKGPLVNDGDGDGDLLVSKRFVMELAGLVADDSHGSQSTGRVVIETRPEWAPLGVAHFHALVKDGFYDQCRFFRVVPKFIVQFGLAADPLVQQKWREKQKKEKLKDDPVERSNQRGTMTFATSGKDTRNTQLFINKRDNAYLDKEGFAPFAQVVEGMEYVDAINSKYKEKPSQGKIQRRGNEYLNEEFPDLSYIVTLREEKKTDRTAIQA